MVPLAALLSCSLYADDALVTAIADNVEQNPLSIVTPDERSDSDTAAAGPSTMDQARAKLGEIMARGGAPLIGLMQVPPAWARTFGREPADLFDSCVNVSIGTAMLSEFDYACARSGRPGGVRTPAKGPSGVAEVRRRCVIDRYASAIGTPEVATVVTLDLRYSRPRPSIESDAPIYSPLSATRTWGADCLFADAVTEWPHPPPFVPAPSTPISTMDYTRVAPRPVAAPGPAAGGWAALQASGPRPR
jgi:hypothetical protein